MFVRLFFVSAMRSALICAAFLNVLAVQVGNAAPAAEKPGDQAVADKLDAARKRLEAAAQEVAELSSQQAGPLGDHIFMLRGQIRRAMLGVQLDPESGKDGARVQNVSPGGPAAEAGVRAGDVIVAINGADLRGGDGASRALVEKMQSIEPESRVKLRVLRDGKSLDLNVTARRSPPMPPKMMMQQEFGPMMEGLEFAMGGAGFGGMELASVSPKLGQYFGVDKGVLVVRAPRDGALKLEDGDVILSIDGREPTSGSHATRILHSYQGGEKLQIRVLRQRKTLNLDATLPEHPKGIRGTRFNMPVPAPMPDAST